MSEYHFSAKKLSVGYDKKPVVSEVDFSVGYGEWVTLIGPNGAGKSTLLKGVAAQLKRISGSAYLGSEELSFVSIEELSKKISILFTDRIKSELMSVYDVVATGRIPYTGRLGLLRDNDRLHVGEALELTGLSGYSGMDFNKLSDGLRQRVMLARCIAGEQPLMIMDEPTSYLDIKNQLEFLTLLDELRKKRDLTVIMSLHELRLAEIFSDRIMAVKDGCIIDMGTAEEIFKPGLLSRLFGLNEDKFSGNKKVLDLLREMER